MPLDKVLLNYKTFDEHICQENDVNNIYGSALGLLLSYTHLIVHESDLATAQDEKVGLIPKRVSYSQWIRFAEAILDHWEDSKPVLPPRWEFGVLRLQRLNLIRRFAPRSHYKHSLRGYMMDVPDYRTFVERNFRWLLVVFAYLSIILGALSLGLGTTHGKNHAAYDLASWVLALMALSVVLLRIGSVVCFVLVVGISNVAFAVIHERKTRLKETKDKGRCADECDKP